MADNFDEISARPGFSFETGVVVLSLVMPYKEVCFIIGKSHFQAALFVKKHTIGKTDLTVPVGFVRVFSILTKVMH